MNWKGGRLDLYHSFTDGFTNGLIKLILIQIIPSVTLQKAVGNFEFCTIFFNYTLYFRGPLVILLAK
jgi:hypothetical protein